MAEKLCPLVKKACLEHQCRWYIQLQGKHPQSGADISEWGCAVEWLPVLLIENAKEVRQGAAATESFRNAMLGLKMPAGNDVLKAIEEKVE